MLSEFYPNWATGLLDARSNNHSQVVVTINRTSKTLIKDEVLLTI